MLTFKSAFERSELLKESHLHSLAKLLENIGKVAAQELYENKDFVNRLYQDELEALAKNSYFIIDDILTNQHELLAKFPEIISSLCLALDEGHGGRHFKLLVERTRSLVDEGS